MDKPTLFITISEGSFTLYGKQACTEMVKAIGPQLKGKIPFGKYEFCMSNSRLYKKGTSTSYKVDADADMKLFRITKSLQGKETVIWEL